MTVMPAAPEPTPEWVEFFDRLLNTCICGKRRYEKNPTNVFTCRECAKKAKR